MISDVEIACINLHFFLYSKVNILLLEMWLSCLKDCLFFFGLYLSCFTPTTYQMWLHYECPIYRTIIRDVSDSQIPQKDLQSLGKWKKHMANGIQSRQVRKALCYKLTQTSPFTIWVTRDHISNVIGKYLRFHIASDFSWRTSQSGNKIGVAPFNLRKMTVASHFLLFHTSCMQSAPNVSVFNIFTLTYLPIHLQSIF